MGKIRDRYRDAKPEPPISEGRWEMRRVLELEDRRIVGDEVQKVQYREVWTRGPCRHVVLDVKTRGPADVPCPECVWPQPWDSESGQILAIFGPTIRWDPGGTSWA